MSYELRLERLIDASPGEVFDAYREANLFTKVDRARQLAYKSTFHMPDGSSFDTELVVSFEAKQGKTLLTIVQSGFESEKDRNDHQGGWPGFLERLDRVVAARKAA